MVPFVLPSNNPDPVQPVQPASWPEPGPFALDVLVKLQDFLKRGQLDKVNSLLYMETNRQSLSHEEMAYEGVDIRTLVMWYIGYWPVSYQYYVDSLQRFYADDPKVGILPFLAMPPRVLIPELRKVFQDDLVFLDRFNHLYRLSDKWESGRRPRRNSEHFYDPTYSTVYEKER